MKDFIVRLTELAFCFDNRTSRIKELLFLIWIHDTDMFTIDYLFDNRYVDGEQRYDEICDDTQSLMEEGHSMYVTGYWQVYQKYFMFRLGNIFLIFDTFSYFHDIYIKVLVVPLQQCFPSNLLALSLRETVCHGHLLASHTVLPLPEQPAFELQLR